MICDNELVPTAVLTARPNVIDIGGRRYGVVQFAQWVDLRPGWQNSPEGNNQVFIPMTDPVWN